MLIYFAQIYTIPNISFEFSHTMQQYLSRGVSERVQMSDGFRETYGADFELMFRIGAKQGLTKCEVHGPTVFKKEHDVEYTIFLPFDLIQSDAKPHRKALECLLDSVRSVLDNLAIDTTNVVSDAEQLTEHICKTPAMFRGGVIRP